MNDKPKLVPLTMMPDAAALKAHPIAAEFPMATDNDFENLKASIADRGFLPDEQITLYGSPAMILDGRNRLKAGLAVGHKFTKENFMLFTGTEAEAEAYSNAKNGARRHLTAEQKREGICGALLLSQWHFASVVLGRSVLAMERPALYALQQGRTPGRSVPLP